MSENIYRRVTRRSSDFSLGQMQNLAAMVWLSWLYDGRVRRRWRPHPQVENACRFLLYHPFRARWSGK